MTFEIWLNDSFYHYDHGKAYHEYGRSRELSASVGIASSGANYLSLADSNTGADKPLFSWFSKFGILEVQSWDRVVDEVIIHNRSSQDLYIWKYVYLRSGETASIRYAEIKHLEHLQGFQPLGMGRLLMTSHQEELYTEYIGHHGLILYKKSSPDQNYVYVRFLRDVHFRSVVLESPGFETSRGELFLNDDQNVLLVTKNAKYVFSLDRVNQEE